MITFHNLLYNHRERTDALISKYIDKYKNSGNVVTIEMLNSLVIENARDVIADLTQSGADVFHQSILNEIKLNTEDLDEIREVNLNAASKYQQELIALSKSIVSVK